MKINTEELQSKLSDLKAKPKPTELLEAMELEDAIRDLELALGIKENTCSLDDEECLSCGS